MNPQTSAAQPERRGSFTSSSWARTPEGRSMQEARLGRGASPSVLGQGGWGPEEAQCFTSHRENCLG